MGTGRHSPYPPNIGGDGTRPVEPPTISDYTVLETGECTLEGDIGIALEKMVENRSLVKFWETLWELGVGTVGIEYMAEKFELEKLNKEGVRFTKGERQQSRVMLRNVQTIRELLRIKQRQTQDTVRAISKES